MDVKYNIFTEEEFIRNYTRIYNDRMLWFMLGSLISSENFWEISEKTTDELYRKLIDKYVVNIYKLSEIANNIDKCKEIPESDQNKAKDLAINGLKTLALELLSIREKWDELHK